MNKLTKKPKRRSTTRQKLPRGWDERRVQKVLAHYENQTEDEAVAEDEAAYDAKGQTVMIVPTNLVPAIRQLLGKRRGALSSNSNATFCRIAFAVGAELR